MILQLARRDPVVRRTWLWALAGLLLGAFHLPLAWLEKETPILWMDVFWMLFIFVQRGQPQLRAHAFQLTLPLRPAELATSRALAGAWMLLVFGGTWAAVVALVGGEVTHPYLSWFLSMVSVCLLLPFLAQTGGGSRESFEAKRPVCYWIRVMLPVVAGAALVTKLSLPLASVAPACLLLAAALAWTNHRAAPAAFEVGPSAPVPASAPSAPAAAGDARPMRRVPLGLDRVPVLSPWHPLNRALAPQAVMRLNLVGLVLGVAVLCTMMALTGEWGAFAWVPTIQAVLLLFASFGLPRLAFLPVSRRRIFAQGAFQGFALAGAGLLLAASGVIPLLFPAVESSLEVELAAASTAAGVACWWVIWFVAVSLVPHFHRESPRTPAQAAVRWGLLGLHLTAAFFATHAPMASGLLLRSLDGADPVQQFTLALGEALGGPATAWAFAVAVAAAAYLGAEAAFARIPVVSLQDRLLGRNA